MTKELSKEIIISIILIVLIVSFLDPFQFWMPTDMAMMLLLVAVVVFLVFAVFIWRETAQDEREEYHRMLAGRVAWLTGAVVLMLALVWQSLAHNIDPWLVYALLAMVVAKVLSRVYGRLKH